MHTAGVAGVAPSHRVEHAGDIDTTAGLREDAGLRPGGSGRAFRASGNRLSCLFTVAAATGLRLGEVLGLKWEDLDWSAKTLRASRALQRVGTPLDDSNVRRVFKGLLKTPNLPDTRLHDLRHTRATLLLAQGAHPRLVQDSLGHSQISLTLDTYTHVLPSLKKEVAAQMQAALGGKWGQLGVNWGSTQQRLFGTCDFAD